MRSAAEWELRSLGRPGRQGEGEFQQRHEGGEGERHVAVLGESTAGRGNCICKSPEEAACRGRARRPKQLQENEQCQGVGGGGWGAGEGLNSGGVQRGSSGQIIQTLRSLQEL